MRTKTALQITRTAPRSWLALFIWMFEAVVILLSMFVVLIRREIQDSPEQTPAL